MDLKSARASWNPPVFLYTAYLLPCLLKVSPFMTVPVISKISNGYSMVCPLVRGDNPRARGLSPVQTDKPWYNYFIPPSSV